MKLVCAALPLFSLSAQAGPIPPPAPSAGYLETTCLRYNDGAPNQAEAANIAVSYGYNIGGASRSTGDDYEFAGTAPYPFKEFGLYYYDSGEFAGNAYYGLGGSVEQQQAAPSEDRKKFDAKCKACNPNELFWQGNCFKVPAPCDKYFDDGELTQAEAADVAVSYGYNLGGNGYEFAGTAPYPFKEFGLYYYDSGDFAGNAYFGLGGSVSQQQEAPSVDRLKFDAECKACKPSETFLSGKCYL